MGRTRGTVEKNLNPADVARAATQAWAAMDDLQKAALAVAPGKLLTSLPRKVSRLTT